MNRKYSHFSFVPLVIVLFLSFLLISQVYAERGVSVNPESTKRRIALVIGNSAYESFPLRNPVNDAYDMAEVLRSLGFDVIHRKNANKHTMVSAINEFGRRIRSADVGFFYYAGHGIQVNGRNYLIPVGSQVESESDVEFESVDAGRLLGKMEDAKSKVNVVILDACRNNPFVRSFRSINHGLAIMKAPTGSFVAFAAAPGSAAADGEGRNGIFTQYLLKHIKTPGLKIEEVLKRTRNDVLQDTDKEQTPWQSSSLTGDFYFVPGQKSASVTPSTPSPSLESERMKLQAERRKLEEEKRLIEERRKLEEERKQLAAEEEQKRLEEQQQKLEEEKRLIEERRKLEEERKQLAAEEEQRRLEEQQQKLEEERRQFEEEKRLAEERERLKKEQEQMKLASLTQDIGKALQGTSSSDGRYIDHGNGTITDTRTNLMWTKKDSWANLGKCLNWNNSKSYVSHLSSGGHSDWRMPTVKELKGIFEKSKNNKDYSGDTIHSDPIFASGGAWGYWSSETVGSSRVRRVNFFFGDVNVGRRRYCTSRGVRAVRP